MLLGEGKGGGRVGVQTFCTSRPYLEIIKVGTLLFFRIIGLHSSLGSCLPKQFLYYVDKLPTVLI